ncbi:MAG: HIT family protein [Gammaproteobacteria bacterium]|nr:HIT family protein [Gammaproteobacteria bacterium]
MSYDENNIFARILRAELPVIKVYEDDVTLAFMDIMPQADGHTLVIPKQRAENLLDLPDEAAADLIVKVKKVACAVKSGLQADGITIFQLNGSAAGQTVPHIHFHILPGSFLNAKTHATNAADPAYIESLAEKIRSAIK